MNKGDKIQYLGHTVKMCTNNDGIVLLSPDGKHLGNFGVNAALAKRFALTHYMMGKPNLRASLASRLNTGSGHWGEYNLLQREMKKDGLTDFVPKTDDLNYCIDFNAITA